MQYKLKMVEEEMDSQILKALKRLFDGHRIVLWYDREREFRDEFEALSLEGVTKLEIKNNEFGIKYRILRKEPENKFLLYNEGPRPHDLDNWLLDILLAYGEFRTDRVGLWLAELGLGPEFSDIVSEHQDFFRATQRREALKKMLSPNDSPNTLRLKMLSVCAGSCGASIDSILEKLLVELSLGKDDKIKLIKRCHLDNFLWQKMEQYFGYNSTEPSIKDFVIQLFKGGYWGELNSDAFVFLKKWKDSRSLESSFEALSNECAEILGIENDLAKRDLRELLEIDYFRLGDQKIISDLIKAVSSRTVTLKEIEDWVNIRRQSHWYGEFKHLYQAILQAARFQHALDEASLKVDDMAQGIKSYSQNWFKIDQIYRKFIYHVQRSGQASLTSGLVDSIDQLYSNNFLLPLNDRWQEVVDRLSNWKAPSILLQRDFFKECVSSFIGKKKKICIIISDALRFEVGEELLRRIRTEDRFVAQIEPALSMLPSYTQLGMAALLPNQTLEIVENENASVLVDDQISQGLSRRKKILESISSIRATALKADEIMGLSLDECREIVKEHEVLYIYHNRIDAIGDKKETEEKVFDAAEETLHELVRLIKKLTNANVNNMLITSDHGFLFKYRPIDESDFSGATLEGKEIWFKDRRFVIGRGLNEATGLKRFDAKTLGLTGDMEVLIPKSINRLRLKGSGSRYVHGGATLQEIVIPVIKVNKKRKGDVRPVEIDIIKSGSSTITSNQFAVILYQTEPVTEKIHPRKLRVGIYNQAGELISDSFEITFDISSENPRDREKTVRFLLTRKADEANGQDVILRLEEKVPGTTHYKEYKTLKFLMRKSFTGDFDF